MAYTPEKSGRVPQDVADIGYAEGFMQRAAEKHLIVFCGFPNEPGVDAFALVLQEHELDVFLIAANNRARERYYDLYWRYHGFEPQSNLLLADIYDHAATCFAPTRKSALEESVKLLIERDAQEKRATLAQTLANRTPR